MRRLCRCGIYTRLRKENRLSVVFEAVVGKDVLSDSVTTIEADAFLDCILSEIKIPDSVTTIETWAFSGCENLQSITIPENVTSIGPWAIGYSELHFLPYWDPVPFGRPVIIYGKRGSEAERYTKDNYWRFNEHITEFRELRTAAGKQEGES